MSSFGSICAASRSSISAYSPRQQRPVSALIAERLPGTLLLTGAAFVIAISCGVGLGALAATRVGTLATA